MFEKDPKVYLLFLFLSVFNSGCNKPEKAILTKAKFFDFPQYFKHQIDTLAKEEYTLNKTINWEDNLETIEIKKPDWNKELLLFREFNPNLPSLIGQYHCDTLVSPSGESEITLEAVDKKLMCRLARININKSGKVMLIEMLMEKKDAFNKMSYTLGYQPMNGFVIQSESFGVGNATFKMDVVGEFQNLAKGY